jgi:hypothetical protein
VVFQLPVIVIVIRKPGGFLGRIVKPVGVGTPAFKQGGVISLVQYPALLASLWAEEIKDRSFAQVAGYFHEPDPVTEVFFPSIPVTYGIG